MNATSGPVRLTAVHRTVHRPPPERVLGRCGEADDDAVGCGYVRTGERMAHHRQPAEGDTRLARPPHHLVLGAVGQGQQHVDARGQPADADVKAGEGIDQRVATPPIANPHPADVAVVCPVVMKSAMVSCEIAST